MSYGYREESLASRLFGVLAHLSSFFAPFLVPIVMLLVFRDPFVRHHAKQSLAFHLLCGVLTLIGWILVIVLIGFVWLWVLGIVYAVCAILGAVRALDGRSFRYPVSGWFIR